MVTEGREDAGVSTLDRGQKYERTEFIVNSVGEVQAEASSPLGLVWRGCLQASCPAFFFIIVAWSDQNMVDRLLVIRSPPATARQDFWEYEIQRLLSVTAPLYYTQ